MIMKIKIMIIGCYHYPKFPASKVSRHFGFCCITKSSVLSTIKYVVCTHLARRVERQKVDRNLMDNILDTERGN